MTTIIDENGLWLDDENLQRLGICKGEIDEFGEKTYFVIFENDLRTANLTVHEVLALQSLLSVVDVNSNGDLVMTTTVQD